MNLSFRDRPNSIPVCSIYLVLVAHDIRGWHPTHAPTQWFASLTHPFTASPANILNMKLMIGRLSHSIICLRIHSQLLKPKWEWISVFSLTRLFFFRRCQQQDHTACLRLSVTAYSSSEGPGSQLLQLNWN